MKRAFCLVILGLLWATPVLADVAPVPSCGCQVVGAGTVFPLGAAVFAALGVLAVAMRRR
ncbi:MAG: MYXO-CTERM sorting domain-containing protein [Myxococcota bacterium]